MIKVNGGIPHKRRDY